MKKPSVSPVTEPVFRLALIYPDGSMLPFDAGGAFERQLIRDCREAIVKRGVGLFATEAQVAAAITEGIAEVLLGLKRESLRVI